MDLKIEGKVAVVTGGSSGIGLATADLLLAEGARVAICGRDSERLQRAARQLLEQNHGGDLYYESCDVLDSGSVANFAAAVEERFQAVDMLINNAGQGRISTFADTTDDDWREEFNLKLFSVIYPTRAFLPLLENATGGSIVCVNSLLARQPEPHMVATSAARASVVNLVRSMATEFAPKGIRVNSVLLGLIESGQWRRRYEALADTGQDWENWARDLAREKRIPLGRLGRTEEAANAIVFLASPRSSFTTGSAIDVSGGLSRYA